MSNHVPDGHNLPRGTVIPLLQQGHDGVEDVLMPILAVFSLRYVPLDRCLVDFVVAVEQHVGAIPLGPQALEDGTGLAGTEKVHILEPLDEEIWRYPGRRGKETNRISRVGSHTRQANAWAGLQRCLIQRELELGTAPAHPFAGS